MTTFEFLDEEFADIAAAGTKAADLALRDPRASGFFGRRAIELSLEWMFTFDSDLRPPYESTLAARLNSPSFRDAVGETIYEAAKQVATLGRKSVHEGPDPTRHDAVAAVSALFEFCYWFARTYNRRSKPSAGLRFDPQVLKDAATETSGAADLVELQAELEVEAEEIALARERLLGSEHLAAEVASRRSEVSQAKRAARRQPDQHDYSETETRLFLIDLLLAEAGWNVTDANREVRVTGMPGGAVGYVDYVLWGDDDKPLALVEAKRAQRDPAVAQQQAVLYADCLEREHGQRPLIFYSNGYEHWIWDDYLGAYPPRRIQGFYKRAELDLLIRRRTIRTSLVDAQINSLIASRPYQHRAIRQIAESLEIDRDRKALLVMATGTGKTRTVVALSDLLLRANWAKRVLFLADRKALVKQAVGVFKEHLPDSAPVNLVTDRQAAGRVYVSTYQTMMGLIDEFDGDVRRFGVGHFDLVVIDEAHRSVFKKYRGIFEYFDSLLVGLTATPKDEIDRNTYSLFDLQTGVPTDVYSLEEAVRDEFLVPPRAFSAPLRFPSQGITYDELSDDEKAEWDELEWAADEDGPGDVPDRVDSAALNSWLFNTTTVDESLRLLMERGLKVAGGDRLGKTIIFAKNQKHAQFIAERFNINFPHYGGTFARVITHSAEHAEDLIDKFSLAESEPHIAISVDMLDTGIDVPEVVNLVFFKPVRSRTKFWQMLGRGTRLCGDLFGPGQDKEYFNVFDHCLNLEYFSQEMLPGDGAPGPSLGEAIFGTRVELIDTLGREGISPALRAEHAEVLRTQLTSMNLDNFLVRPHRQLVERFREPAAWESLGPDDQAGLVRDLASLPHALPPEPEEAKRFDLLMLTLQLALLQRAPGYERLRAKVIGLAELLQAKTSIPRVAEEFELINEMAGDLWWQDLMVEQLEDARRRLRDLVVHLDAPSQAPLYTNFRDELVSVAEVDVGELGEATSFVKFRRKAAAYLQDHLGHGAVHKIHTNQPLTEGDLDELKSLFVAAGLGSPADLDSAAENAGSFAQFVRSLTGLDRGAALKAFARFLSEDAYRADQIRFVNLVVDYVVSYGTVDSGQLYDSPFTDVSPSGPEDLFSDADIDELIGVIDGLRVSLHPGLGR